MKKVVLATLFAASLGLVSCNNGVYDANPAVDNSAAGNPLANSGVAARGQMVATINGSKRVFSNAFYSVGGGSAMMLGASVSDNVTHTITIGISNYNGVGTYHVLSTDAQAKYGELNSALVLTEYDTNSSQPGFGEIVVTEDNGGEIKGTFYFTAHNSANVPSTVSVVNGTFDLPKQ